MALVPHKVVALNELNEGEKNTIAGAPVSLFDMDGNAVTLFDDESGSNGSTAKQTDSEGVVVVYVTAGEYDEQVNGGIQRRVLVGNKEITTEQLIERIRKARDGDVIATTGFYSAGDGGSAQWVATSTTGLTPSQTPADRGAAELVDGSGRLWELSFDSEINILSLGCIVGPGQDSYPYAAAAINSLVDGQVLFFPTVNGGVYGLAQTLVIPRGIYLRFEGYGDSAVAASPNDAVPSIRWMAGSGQLDMLKWENEDFGGKVFYGGIKGGVVIDGNNEAGTCIHLSSVNGWNAGVIRTYRATLYGTRISSENGNLSSEVFIQKLGHFCGNNVATWNATGFFIDGDIAGPNSTTHHIIDYSAEYVYGDGLCIVGCDTATFDFVKAASRFDDENIGYAVRFKRSENTAFHSEKNIIKHLGRGTVYVEDDTKSNAIYYINGEGGKVEFEGGVRGKKGSLYYMAADRKDGDFFDTMRYKMKDKKSVTAGEMILVSGSPSLVNGGNISLPVPAWSLDPSSAESVGFFIAPDYYWSNGRITGVEYGFYTSGTSGGDASIELALVTSKNGAAPTGANKTFKSTVSMPATDNTFVVSISPLTVPVSGVSIDSTCRVSFSSIHTINNRGAVVFSGIVGTDLVNGKTYYANYISSTEIDLYKDPQLRYPIENTTAYTSGGIATNPVVIERDGLISGKVTRVSTDAADTCADDIYLTYVKLTFECWGPDEGGTTTSGFGPWQIPSEYLV